MNKYYLLFLIGLFLCCLSCTNLRRQVKPNVIIINIDDLGWRDLGFMGSQYYETPNIDSLVRMGMYFTNGYASAANCAPSRASLMTGLWSTRHGIYTVNSSERGKAKDRMIIPTKNTTTLSEEFTVLPEVLDSNGYFTIHAGKWHLNENPLEFGFDVNIGGGHNGHPRSYYPPYGNVDLNGDQYLTNQIMANTIACLDTINEPFFLNYAPYAVHTPIQPIDSLLSKYESKPKWNNQNNAEYATMIDNLDSNIGLLISMLHEKALFDNTLIIFMSDNGGLFGITNQRPLRAGKGSYYEGGIRVPFFFVWKDKIKANTQSETPISNLDIFPTVLSLAEISTNDFDPDGMDLEPIFSGNGSIADRPLYWHFPIYLQAYNAEDNENRDPLFRTRPGSVVRFGKWKLHYYFEKDEIELFNLDEDIGEKNNLGDSEPEITKMMLDFLQNWWEETDAPIPSERNPDFKGTEILEYPTK